LRSTGVGEKYVGGGIRKIFCSERKKVEVSVDELQNFTMFLKDFVINGDGSLGVDDIILKWG
jgi:hypothetical protein